MRAKKVNENSHNISLNKDDIEFIDYVCNFYAFDTDGHYSSHFNDKLSCKMIKDAYIKWRQTYPDVIMDTREAFKAWLWELYPNIVDGKCEYSYTGLFEE